MGDRNQGGTDYSGAADKSRAEGNPEDREAGESVNDTGREGPGTAGEEPTEPSAAPSAGSDSGDESTEGSEADGTARRDSGDLP